MTAFGATGSMLGTSRHFAASSDTRAHGALSLLMLSSVEQALTVARPIREAGSPPGGWHRSAYDGSGFKIGKSRYEPVKQPFHGSSTKSARPSQLAHEGVRSSRPCRQSGS